MNVYMYCMDGWVNELDWMFEAYTFVSKLALVKTCLTSLSTTCKFTCATHTLFVFFWVGNWHTRSNTFLPPPPEDKFPNLSN